MFSNYLKSSYRNLLANKTITALNIFGLAIGVAVCMIIGVWLQRELNYDNFHVDGEKIFRLSNTFQSESESFSQAPSGSGIGAQLPKLLPDVESACRVFGATYKLQYEDKLFIEENAAEVDSNFFEFFGFQLKKGNPATALIQANQIVLTQSLAKKYFGDADPMNKTITMDGQYQMVVSGVAADPPVNSHIQFDMLVSSSFLKALMTRLYQFDIDNEWLGGWPNTYVALKNPEHWKEAEQKINDLVAEKSKKEWEENQMSYAYFLQPIRDIHLKSALRYDALNNGSLARVRVFGIAGLIVLLLACVNYINLTTAGAMKRAKETGVKKVVGAAKHQLVQQFLLETCLVCITSVGLGCLLFEIALPYFSTWIGEEFAFHYNLTNLGILAGSIGALTLLSGFYPAAVLSSFRLSTVLKGNFSHSTSGNWLRKGLVVFQFTSTIAIIAAIIIMNEQMGFIRNKSLGYEGRAVITIPFYGEAVVRNQYETLRNELMKSPYILNVTKHGGNVVGGLGNGWTKTENLKGEAISTSLYNLNVDTTYFDTYDLQLVTGRFFSSAMPTDTTKSVLVNEAAVRTFGWETPENAIGKKFGENNDIKQVIGVVRDFHFESLHKPVEAVLIDYAINGSNLSLKLNATHLDAAVKHLQGIWSKMITDVPLEYSFVDEQVAEQYGNEQKMEGVFYAFSFVSLFVACLGLFGLSMFVVERKTKEVGIRKVLGASVSQIVAMLSKDFIVLVLISMLIASPIAWYLMHQWLNGFAYRIDISWWMFLLAGMIAIVIALATVSLQSIKAATSNPVKSLRLE